MSPDTDETNPARKNDGVDLLWTKTPTLEKNWQRLNGRGFQANRSRIVLMCDLNRDLVPGVKSSAYLLGRKTEED